MAYTPCGFQVEGPKITPNRYGLLTVTEPLTPDDRHWEGGITWNDDLCSDIHSTVGFCPIPATGSTPKIADQDFQSCCADPFIVYGSYDCPPVGKLPTEAFMVAKKRLHIREEQEVERTFWTGVTDGGINVNPSLAFGNETCGSVPIDLTPASGPISIVTAMAVLESALGDCSPGAGVIHANYGLASFLAAAFLIYPKGDAWFTVTGQRLAIGAGYPGSGPNNVAAEPGTTWIFATGPVAIWRSEVFLTPARYLEALDRTLNSVQVYAERSYAVGWSCCLYAICVNLCP